MRGVYSMGALAALEQRGHRSSFGVCVGSSAGAINCSYLLAGQAKEAVTVYTDYLSNSAFINPFRFWKIVDIDYLVDDVLRLKCPLDVEAVRRSPSILKMVLTNASTGEPHIVSSRDRSFDYYEAIRATAAMPILYNRLVRVGDDNFIDGGVANSLPLDFALSGSSRVVVVVATRPRGYRHVTSPFVIRHLSRALAISQGRGVRARIGSADTRFNAAMDLMESAEVGPVRFVCVQPSDASALAGRTTANKSELERCAQLGIDDMNKALDLEI